MNEIRCVVACVDASGAPAFFPCTVPTTQYEYDEGFHYDLARHMADEAGYETGFQSVVFDENDGPDWLFAQMFPAPTQQEGMP